MERAFRREAAPCLVVGRSIAALYRAAALQRSTFTVLLTPSETSVDPYTLTSIAVDSRFEDTIIRPAEVLAPGTVMYGRLLGIHEPYVQIVLANGARIDLPVRAVILEDLPPFRLNGVDWTEWKVDRRDADRFSSGALTVSGHGACAASAAAELLLSPSKRLVTWQIETEESVSRRWKSAIERFGGTIETTGLLRSTSTRSRTMQTDDYGRLIGHRCSFRHPVDEIVHLNDRLSENISTCVFSTGRYPIMLKRLGRQGHVIRSSLVLPHAARSTLLRRGFIRWALTVRRQEQRVKNIRAAIEEMRRWSEMRWRRE